MFACGFPRVATVFAFDFFGAFMLWHSLDLLVVVFKVFLCGFEVSALCGTWAW